MKTVLVENSKHIRAFLDLPNTIYKDNTTYIKPLDKDIEAVFGPKNKMLKHGEVVRWLLMDGNNCIGRIAAFTNEKHSSQFEGIGGIGFFECINNQDAANILFKQATKWLQDKGLKGCDGPINFGEKDKFWGLLTSNFELGPCYGQNYSAEYYPKLWENFGFKEYYKQLIFLRSGTDKLQAKYQERADHYAQDPDFKVEFIKKNNLKKYQEDFRSIYNEAWGKRDGEGFKGMSSAQAASIMKSLKPIMDENLICFGYKAGKPIAFFIGLPEVNSIFKKFKGKLAWYHKLWFMFLLKTGYCKTCFGLAFGVSPDYQGLGVEGALFSAIEQKVVRQGMYENVIVTWLGDFNHKMIKIMEGIGGEVGQELATMRYYFDENHPFERYNLKA